MQSSLFPFYIFTFFTSLLLTAFFEKRWIPHLSRRAKQPIYAEGPAWHIKKSGTPTMGGLAFLASTVGIWAIAALFLSNTIDRRSAVSFSLSVGFALLNASLGVIDDLTKLRRKQNAGLSPIEKLVFQFIFAALFLFGRAYLLGDTTKLLLAEYTVDLGFFYYPMALLLLVGVVNFANLTDGIDGLASSVAFGIAASLFFIAAYVNTEVCVLAALIMGMSVGFLMFNLHPAKIFMGDTGSLFLGALIVACCFSLGNPLIVLGVGSVYILEGLSVVLQVLFFKATKKRIFLMAPLHHHFEKLGWSENRICLVAMLLTLLCSVPSYLLFLSFS